MATGEVLITYPGLQGLWHFEGNVNDSSANGYNLTTSGTPGYVAGKFAQGLELETDSSQYASIAHASCANLRFTGSRTLMAWIKPESTCPGFWGIITKQQAGYTGYLIGLYSNNAVRVELVGGITETSVGVTSAVAAPIGSWTLVGYVYDATLQRLKVWVNGVKLETQCSGTSTDASNAPFAVGCTFNGAGNTAVSFFDGTIDEVAAFNVAWTDKQWTDYYAWASGKRAQII